ncbi:unnamed protein product [Diamesa serratosioi]
MKRMILCLVVIVSVMVSALFYVSQIRAAPVESKPLLKTVANTTTLLKNVTTVQSYDIVVEITTLFDEEAATEILSYDDGEDDQISSALRDTLTG